AFTALDRAPKVGGSCDPGYRGGGVACVRPRGSRVSVQPGAVMTASFRVPRVRPPVSLPVRPSSRPPHPPFPTADSNELTVSITVRGEAAISAIAPLVAAVRSLGSVQVTIDELQPLRPAADRLVCPGAALQIRINEYCALLDGVPLNLTRREFDL